MTYKEPLLSILVLDFKRGKEACLLFDTLSDFFQVPAKVVYCHDGPPEQYVLDLYKEGRIDTLLYTKENRGCGIQTRQLFQAAMTPLVAYVQVDQFLCRPFTQASLNKCIEALKQPDVFYVDLAGDQGRGRPSERALLMERKKYLDIPGIDDIVGGPGPFANERWGEKHLQDYMADNHLRFMTSTPPLFADNGKSSLRAYPCGGQTLHFTDTKELFIIKPFARRYDGFPALTLNDEEWTRVLAGEWPKEGAIPEHEKAASFVCFDPSQSTQPSDLLHL